ncbi:MerR family transcriptional regulator [Blautia sp. HCN-1074]|jgi:DNA-binding transcriptional MerR regulator|uniref:MerR family transcriptional regulator n=1 Tax=Blautia sp. HCN-1074 TaxID=3134667 RepID=UPI000E4CE20E|nr:MerR family transcriptional regulator [Ruminococcus sp. AF13-37]RGW19730.1 MerR family transcriptional regulator [Ruminococcus sp. AF13-28]RHJ94545.1 MerR family transcriptional regulator [Ruminococcus sp. AM07-21]RHO86064.1 MerR family transcriptional regulator [Ruminococcus sp. AF42-9BH]RHP54543.1 MerR family transcriptional regulator [Ruminococcus sp. AF31-16BH]RHQ63565.1 MerR family transcriptional regulator [Ruminococcus sp. AF24-32LB]RHQ98673.1 MerR family transcriptional regulator [
MIRDTYMTTGEFAKLMKISKHTLFHYDDIGLFCPEILGENGYRYYSIYQMETLDTILLLKKSGMSLQEIKDFLEHRSSENFMKIFDVKQKEIDQEISRLLAMKEWMSQRKAKIQYMQKCDFSEIKVIYHPERYYLYEEFTDTDTTDKEFMLKINKLISKLEELDRGYDYDVAYMQFPQEIENSVYDGYHNAILLLQKKIQDVSVSVLPKGNYLSAYHVGHWENIGETYERLLAYIKEHKIKTEGNYLEYYVVDNFTAKQIEDYVTEISIKIQE